MDELDIRKLDKHVRGSRTKTWTSVLGRGWACRSNPVLSSEEAARQYVGAALTLKCCFVSSCGGCFVAPLGSGLQI